jgi:hypothetical protein
MTRPQRLLTRDQPPESAAVDQEIAWLDTWHMTDERIAQLLGLSVEAVQVRRRHRR